ncbi:MAG: hypothetical protein PHN56_07210, partial [Candidatus Nanoarchaeia archaeon]|nr:hypothetical protein [Candidatus Nanoarchaeia archaeon]
ERDKKGRFLPKHKCLYADEFLKKDGIYKGNVYGNPNGSKLLGEIVNPSKNPCLGEIGEDERLVIKKDSIKIIPEYEFFLWIRIIGVSLMIGLILGLLMIKIL